jgi:hypothetical protein
MEASITAIVEDNDGTALPQASVTVRHWDGSILEELTTNDEGVFYADLPPFSEFFIIAETTEHPPTSFTGYSGEGDYTVPAGTLSLRTFDEVHTSLSDFTDCYTDAALVTEAVVEGQARLFISGTATEDLPTMTTGTASLVEDDVSLADGCYLAAEDEDGNPITSDETGETGRYAIFSPPTGVAELSFTISVDGEQISYPYSVYVPENGVVPMFPTLVPFLEQ